jgi:pyridoxal phosphate enzyme (YggS family)
VGLLRYRGSMSEIDGSAHAAILARIAAAAKQAGRDPAAVRLVAVSKQQLPERVAAVLAAGQRLFGENRVQEAIQRWTPLKDQHADLQLRLIGPLQSNKAKDAVAFFDAIDSVDRDKLARALADEIQRQAKTPALLIQINTGEEPQKAGVLPAEADAFIKACRTDYGLDIKGLMAIPPQDEEPAMHFALLAKIAARNGLSELSMGMSGDFETAIRFGATMVRVGSAVFGDRAPPPNL